MSSQLQVVSSQFSLNDCTEILKNFLKTIDYTVDSYSCSFLNGLGFLADHCILKINYNAEGKKDCVQFFVKIICSGESQRSFTVDSGAFYKECRIFQELIPEFQKNNIDIINDCVPKCYLVSDMKYLAFENLGDEGYRIVTARECMSLECVKICLEALAKFHCSALIYEEIMSRKTGVSYKLSEKFPKLFEETFYRDTESTGKLLEAIKTGVVTQIELFADSSEVDTELFKKMACDIFDNFPDIVKPSILYRNTMCHGDLWTSNLMFKFEHGKVVQCKLVDFQSYRYAPPAQDFLSFIYFSTDRKFRMKHMEEVTSYYYGKMTQIFRQFDLCIEKVLPNAEFVESCNYYRLFAIVQPLHYFPHIMLTPEQVKIVHESPGGMQKVLFENKRDVILDVCGKDDVYRKRLSDPVIDLKDALIEMGLLK